MSRVWWRVTGLVAAREWRARTRPRSFRIVTALLMLAVAAAVVVPRLTSGSESIKKVGIVGSDQTAAKAVQLTGSVVGSKVRVIPVTDPESARRQLRKGSLDVVLIPGREVLIKQQPAVGLGSDTATLANALAQLSRRASTPPEPKALPVRALTPPPGSLTPRITGMVVLILIYVLIFVYGQRIAQGVGDEKQSRVAEVLLATVQPTQLLTGKVIGMGLVALAQVATMLVVFLGSGLAVGSSLIHGATGGVVAFGALWFILGYAFYCTAFGAIGSLLSRSGDAANATFPMMIPMIVAYSMSFSVLFGDASTFFRILAFIPLTAPMAMPTLYAIGAASTLEITISVAITIIATVAMARLGGMIYGRAIMRTGARVRLREVLGSGENPT